MKKFVLSLFIALVGVTGLSAQSSDPDYPTVQLGDNSVDIKKTEVADYKRYTMFKFVAPESGLLLIPAELEYYELGLFDRSYEEIEMNNLIENLARFMVEKNSVYYIGIYDSHYSSAHVDYSLHIDLIPMADPVLVTEENFANLGLDAKYVGSYAISNRAQFLGFAQRVGGMVHYVEEERADQRDDVLASTLRRVPKGPSRMVMSNDDPETTPEPLDDRTYVLTTNIVVNEDLIKDGTLNIEENGRLREHLIAWSTIDLHYAFEETSFVFDGNGHTISGLYQNEESDYSLGFVTQMNEESAVRNLGITQSYFTENYVWYAGIFVGVCYGTVENCWSDATLKVNKSDNMGGIVAYMTGGSIKDCKFFGTLMVANYAPNYGGIVGYVYVGDDEVAEISNCHFMGNVMLSYDCAFSGIVYNAEVSDYGKLNIDRCSAEGSVLSGDEILVAGIVRWLYTEGDSCQISNCYNAMTLKNVTDVDVLGICGSESQGLIKIKNCFSYVDDSNLSRYCPIVPPGSFSVENCYYLSDEDDTDSELGSGVSAETFASGKVAYLLCLENESPWYQKIGRQPYPVLESEDPEYEIVMFDRSTGIYFNRTRSLEEFTLCDEAPYSMRTNCEVLDFTYERTFLTNKWEALYVPFEIDVNAWKENFDIAAIRNFHEYYDAAGAIEYRELEVRILKSGQTKANYPYLIRAKVAGEKSIEMQNVTLYPSKENAISCASTDTKYTFSGIYSGFYLTFASCYVEAGCLYVSNSEVKLPAQRWYLTAEKYDYQWEDAPAEPIELSSNAIRIVVMGEEETGICEIENGELKMENSSFNLQGQRITAPQKGLNIINGQRRLIK